MQELVSKRRRSRFRGVLDSPQGGPNVGLFGTDSGATAAFYDFRPTEQPVLPPLETPSEHAFLHFGMSSATELFGEIIV